MDIAFACLMEGGMGSLHSPWRVEPGAPAVLYFFFGRQRGPEELIQRTDKPF